MIRLLIAAAAVTCFSNVSFAQCDMQDRSCFPAVPKKLAPLADPISTPDAPAVEVVSCDIQDPSCTPYRDAEFAPAMLAVEPQRLGNQNEFSLLLFSAQPVASNKLDLLAEFRNPAFLNRV